jgi:hypothetical protein
MNSETGVVEKFSYLVGLLKNGTNGVLCIKAFGDTDQMKKTVKSATNLDQLAGRKVLLWRFRPDGCF